MNKRERTKAARNRRRQWYLDQIGKQPTKTDQLRLAVEYLCSQLRRAKNPAAAARIVDQLVSDLIVKSDAITTEEGK